MSSNKNQNKKTNHPATQNAEKGQTSKDTSSAKTAAQVQSAEKKTAETVNQTEKNATQQANKAKNTTSKSADSAVKKADAKPQGQPQDKSQAKPQSKPNNKAAEKPTQKADTQTTSHPQPPKKKGSLGTALALLLGVAGTGLGAYSFNELRTLKTNLGSTNNVGAQITSLSDKVSGLEKNTASADIKKQLAELAKQQTALKTAETRFNERVAQVEQMQKGLSQSVTKDIDSALKSRMGAVDTLLAKVKDIELGQQGLSKNLNQVNAGSQAINQAGMAKQEVGYLLRMASYKIQSEGDVAAATGLLKMAESKLLAANQGKTDALVDAIRDKLIQLSGVQTVDKNALIAELKTVSQSIAQLVVKPSGGQAQPIAPNIKDADSTWDKVKSAMMTGITYTPADPSKIDISAETVLIEKRLMQADIKTAEFAIQSRNKVLLGQSIQSVLDSLNQYFAADKTAKNIREKLTELSQSQLETALPDLSGLVKQFEKTQKIQ